MPPKTTVAEDVAELRKICSFFERTDREPGSEDEFGSRANVSGHIINTRVDGVPQMDLELMGNLHAAGRPGVYSNEALEIHMRLRNQQHYAQNPAYLAELVSLGVRRDNIWDTTIAQPEVILPVQGTPLVAKDTPVCPYPDTPLVQAPMRPYGCLDRLMARLRALKKLILKVSPL